MPNDREAAAGASLSDAEIQRIARRIVDESSRRPPNDPNQSILAQGRELPRADEDRVIAAIEALRAERPAEG